MMSRVTSVNPTKIFCKYCRRRFKIHHLNSRNYHKRCKELVFNYNKKLPGNNSVQIIHPLFSKYIKSFVKECAEVLSLVINQ